MKQSAKYHLTGVAPLLMHNGQLADPLNQWSKAISKITAKQKKTEADHQEIARLEWMGGLYLFNGAPCIPREALKATLYNAAKKVKKGPKVKSGVVCEHTPLIYDGPTDPKALWDDGRFSFRTTKPQQKSRIVRTRPIFSEWKADILIVFNDEIINPGEVDDLVAIGGHTIGLLEERPEYGTYTVQKY